MRTRLSLAVVFSYLAAAFTFSPRRIQRKATIISSNLHQEQSSFCCSVAQHCHFQLYNSKSNNNNNIAAITDSDNIKCWNPTVRIVMGTLGAAGLVETAFLSYVKLFGEASTLAEMCGLSGDCGSVLNGPYAIIPGTTNLPLALLGMVAYAIVTLLAVQPLLASPALSEEDEDVNRVLLAAVSTGMGVFSACLMVLLYGVLHESCKFCVASAVLSVLLTKLAWATSLVPKQHTKSAIQTSIGTSLTALVAAATIVLANTSPSDASAVNFAGTLVGNGSSSSSSLAVAAYDKSIVQVDKGLSPPLITTTSSPQALQLASKLQSLDTRLFGAYWCSHCYDQKQTLGEQAMRKIPYVECSKEGFREQSKLCKEANVPGYPTWEIAGKLYPGEQSLEELEEIVAKAVQQQQNNS
ncbi:hypothetical protein MPSEU_000200000 [Mayamaea pseudoterrestris]|nr:hypothetical protein MPSEU_000200000 [Mayamaea pseudoterrestris]